MTSTLRTLPEAGTYRRADTVEAIMARRGLVASEGAAHQMLLRIHRALGPIGECFVEAGATERALGFTRPFEAALERAAIPDFRDASLAEAESDGDEDTAWENWNQSRTPANPHGCPKLWSQYKRVAHRDVARLLMKLRAGDAAMGLA